MRLLLCADSFSPREPDAAFETENAAISRLDLQFDLLDFEALIGGETHRAVRRLPSDGLGLVVYRGWMLPVASYVNLADAIGGRGGHLINDPEMYEGVHHLPSWYPSFVGHTPETVWLTGEAPFDMARVHRALEVFGDRAVIVKDFVKSRKHEWAEACFIPAASDRAAVERVVGTFVERQGEDLAGGLVFREFVELETVGNHPTSGLSLGREYRLFFLDGLLLVSGRYWEDVDYPDDLPVDRFTSLASAVKSRFFSMDIAQTRRGEWIVIELGDGQVTGLPETFDATAFYTGLAAGLDTPGEPSR